MVVLYHSGQNRFARTTQGDPAIERFQSHGFMPFETFLYRIKSKSEMVSVSEEKGWEIDKRQNLETMKKGLKDKYLA
jgi:hypothetical protein